MDKSAKIARAKLLIGLSEHQKLMPPLVECHRRDYLLVWFPRGGEIEKQPDISEELFGRFWRET
jgi:hypothetical protein